MGVTRLEVVLMVLDTSSGRASGAAFWTRLDANQSEHVLDKKVLDWNYRSRTVIIWTMISSPQFSSSVHS